MIKLSEPFIYVTVTFDLTYIDYPICLGKKTDQEQETIFTLCSWSPGAGLLPLENLEFLISERKFDLTFLV
jgi:hypothetical protein